MKYVKLWESFTYELNENTAEAKKYVIKLAATGLDKEADELTDVERSEALEDPNVREIFSLTKNHVGYTLPFLRFYFEHGAQVKSPADAQGAASLEYLMEIIRNRKHLLSQLPHNFAYYASLKTENGITGFERLTDDLRTIERAKEAKWFIDSLPRPLRDQYRELPKAEQNRVINIAIQLKELGKSAIARLFDKIKALSSWKILDVINYSANFVKGYSNLGMRKKIDELEELSPEAGIVYQDDNYLVLSVRTEAAQTALCSVANWCINRGAWRTYDKESIQLNIFNFSIDPSDPLFLTGTTVYYTGEVRTSHDINDKYIGGGTDLAKHFRTLGYPDELIDSVMDQFQNEVMIKKVAVDLKLDSQSPDEILTYILVNSYRGSGKMSDEVTSAIFQILDSRLRARFSREMIVRIYAKHGALTLFAVKLLKFLLEDMTSFEKDSIASMTRKAFRQMRLAVDHFNRLGRTIPSSVSNTLAQEKEVIAELED